MMIQVKAESEAGMTTVTMMMTLTSAGRQGVETDRPDRPWPIKNHIERAQLTPSQSKAASPLHLSHEGENPAGPSCVGLDSSAAENDLPGEDAGETGETPQVQSGDCSSEGHPSLSENQCTSDPQAALPEVGEGDHPGLQDRPAVPVSGDTMSSRSSLSCRAV